MNYCVLLGIDRAGHDTGRRLTMQVRESDPLSAAIAAETMADRQLQYPDVEYTHAMRVTPAIRAMPAAAVPLAVAA